MNLEKAYFYWDETKANLIVMAVTGILLGTAVFLLLDSADATPDTDINLSVLNQEYKENATCIPPYRDKACYPPENNTEQDNLTPITDINELCKNGTVVQGNESDLVNDSDGVYCRL